MRPNKEIARAYLSRGARLWLALRLLLTGALIAGGTPPFQISPVVVVAIILLSVFLSFIDTYRYRERVLLANLGLRPVVLALLFLIPAVIGEVSLQLGSALFR